MTRTTLKPSTMHRILASPLGRPLASGVFNDLKLAMLPREFRMARARAVAFQHDEPEAFLAALGADQEAKRKLLEPAARALTELALRRKALRPVEETWERAMWEDLPIDASDLVALEEERRSLSERAIKPGMLFRFLWSEPSIAPTGFSVPAPVLALQRSADWLANPAELYAAPADPGEITRSNAIPGPVGEEYLLRFRSPSAFTNGDVVTARVYDPAPGNADIPSFIFGSGLGMSYDLIRYWPEEDYMARRLAARGIRTILPESPWHGRRELPGCYSGEPYLARAPVSIFELFSAQCQEAAVLVAWARENGSRKVGVGGVSLGGLVTQQIVGHCGGWPEAMRPDMAFVGAGSGHVDQVVALGHLSKLLGLTDAVRQAGWTDQLLAELRPLLDPPDTESIDPEAIVACLGTRDSSTPFRLASDLLDRWRVPDENRIIRDEDHMALYTFLIRKPDVADRIAACLLSDAV